ncbi:MULTISPECIES: ETC complex I subunit [unclassified Sphingomonas]|uniref:ETC complex I subunit n=1 Tax=unclassified Sphingomonas TaxID=196159 RepID=UPI0006F35A2B|nr:MULTISPECIES: ETC complex I subunit [unclassified Sphingomonas]KQX20732.1 oxidoreductase [Sphingomonas sp. Root1294]KQY68578.1 oxidoreductase [Sphingomonas sp. Root50]KRB87984.1 oxidoreductase [Sphingomonas sp. Root720]
MAHARIYQQIKNAMQSGRARTGSWVLEHEPTEAKRPDPLTGWAGSGDTRDQVRLTFPTLEAAKAYAESAGLTAHVVAGPEKKLKLQAYADNFMVGPINL